MLLINVVIDEKSNQIALFVCNDKPTEKEIIIGENIKSILDDVLNRQEDGESTKQES
jgi:hypothetical protein